MANANAQQCDSDSKTVVIPDWKISSTDQERAATTTWDDVSNTIYPVGKRSNSAELLRRLSDLVDGIVRLSCIDDHLPISIGQSRNWTMLDYTRELVSVTGTQGAVQAKLLSKGNCTSS